VPHFFTQVANRLPISSGHRVKDARSYDGLSVSWQGDDRASTSVVANSIETYWRSQSCV